MRDWVITIHSFALLIIAIVLYLTTDHLRDVWKEMLKELWALRGLMQTRNCREEEDTCAGNKSKSTSM